MFFEPKNPFLRLLSILVCYPVAWFCALFLGLAYDEPPWRYQSRLKGWLREYWPVLGILILGAVLRFVQLGTASFWYDEAITGWFARLPMPQMITATAGDTHPPLYYGIIWLINHTLGSSEWLLRLPSTLASLAGLVLVWRISGELVLSRPIRLVALGFMALSPFEIHFAQEARMYAFLQLLVLAAWLAILRRRWGWLFVWSLLLLYTHNYGLIYLPVLAGLAFLREIKRPVHVGEIAPIGLGWKRGDEANFKSPLLALLGSALLWLPWAAVLFRQMQIVAGGYWIEPVNAGSILYCLNMLLWSFAMPEKIQPLSVLITFGLVSYALSRLLRHPGDYLSLALLALGPLALAVGASWAWKPILLFRGLAGSAPALYLWLSKSLIESKPVYKPLYAGVLVTPVLLAGLIGHYTYNVPNKGDTPQAVRLIRDQWRAGDLVLHLNDGTAVNWMYYGADLPQAELATCAPDPGGLSVQTRQAMGIQQLTGAELSAQRVWVVWGDGPTSQLCEAQLGKQITDQAQLVKLYRDDQYVYSGVWRYDRP